MFQLVIGIMLLLVGIFNLYFVFFIKHKQPASVRRRKILGILFCVIGIADILFYFIKANLPPQ
jgi:uncharacterized membrane protein HdeD (DUF308 family)